MRELMTYPPFVGRRPIFIGDDVTDFGVFAIIPDFDGISISVGPKISGVDFCFRDRWMSAAGSSKLSRNDAFAAS